MTVWDMNVEEFPRKVLIIPGKILGILWYSNLHSGLSVTLWYKNLDQIEFPKIVLGFSKNSWKKPWNFLKFQASFGKSIVLAKAKSEFKGH